MKETDINKSNDYSQLSLTHEEALAKLKQGNYRFMHAEPKPRELLDQVQRTAKSQSPFAIILGCIDSRVPPEIIFDQGIGDLMTIRTAGNVVGDDVLGSLEFGVEFTQANLILVLGHTNCGAVMGAADDVRVGHLTALLEKIRPAFQRVSVEGPPSSKNAPFMRAAVMENVVLSMDKIKEESPLIAKKLSAGEVRLVGAIYDVASGKVEFLNKEG